MDGDTFRNQVSHNERPHGLQSRTLRVNGNRPRELLGGVENASPIVDRRFEFWCKTGHSPELDELKD